MRTDTRPIQITLDDLRIDPEGTIRGLPAASEAVIVSADGTVLAMIASPASLPDLTSEQVTEIRKAIAEFEKEDPSQWMDHDEFMRILEEDERSRENQ